MLDHNDQKPILHAEKTLSHAPLFWAEVIYATVWFRPPPPPPSELATPQSWDTFEKCKTKFLEHDWIDYVNHIMYFLQPKMPQKMLFVWVWASQSMSQMFQTIRTTMLKNREAIWSVYDYKSHADVQTKDHLRDNGWESQIGNLAKTWDSKQVFWKPPPQKI